MKYRPDMKDHPLTQAAREVNDSPDSNDLEKTCGKHGLKLEDVMYMAEQRALRVINVGRGIVDMRSATNKPLTLRLSAGETMLMPTLIAAYMDGMLIGWRAREIEKNTTELIELLTSASCPYCGNDASGLGEEQQCEWCNKRKNAINYDIKTRTNR